MVHFLKKISDHVDQHSKFFRQTQTIDIKKLAFESTEKDTEADYFRQRNFMCMVSAELSF